MSVFGEVDICRPTPLFVAPSIDQSTPPTPPSGVALVVGRSEEHTSELQSLAYLVCRLLLEKKKTLQFLEQFVKESPNHPQAADANSERAQILLGKARVEILQSKAPANQGAKVDYQKRSRGFIGQAFFF